MQSQSEYNSSSSETEMTSSPEYERCLSQEYEPYTSNIYDDEHNTYRPDTDEIYDRYDIIVNDLNEINKSLESNIDELYKENEKIAIHNIELQNSNVELKKMIAENNGVIRDYLIGGLLIITLHIALNYKEITNLVNSYY